MIKCVKSGIAVLFSAMMLCILTLVVGCFDQIAFAGKRVFLLGQGTMLCIGLAAAALLMIGACRMRRSDTVRRLEPAARVWLWPMLFAVQLALCYFTYFLTGWDAGMMLEYARWVGVYGATEVNDLYYSMYPNNVLITMIFAGIMRAFAWITGGEPGLERCALAVIAVQCLLNTLTGAMCWDIVRRWTRSKTAAWITAFAYVLLVGLSPWLMIPYTDSMALFLPTLILWLYVQKERLGIWAFAGIGLLAGFGYRLKPQAVIVVIALVMVEAAYGLCARYIKRMLVRLSALLLAMLVMIGPFFDAVVRLSGFDLDEEMNVGALHYVMMGLNEASNGGFYAEDEKITLSASTRKARRAVQLEQIAGRVKAYGFAGLMEHLTKKTMTNYADGTFAWAIEGQFIARQIEDKDEVISPLLKRMVYPDEQGNVSGIATYAQCIWLALLLGALLGGMAVLTGRAEGALVFLTMMLAIIGLTTFELLFEARARYLFIYAPVYVMLGVNGLWSGFNMLKKKAEE